MQNQSMLMRLEESVRSSSSSKLNKQPCFSNFSIEIITFLRKNEKLALACIEPGDFLESISERKFQFLGNFENICEILFSESNV